MERTLSRNWWAFALRGALAIAFALLVVIWSNASASTLARVFAVFAIGEGALAIGATMGGKRDRAWSLVLEGAFGIGFGLVALIAPFRSLSTVAWVIASWIAMVGLLEGATALRFRKHVVTPRLLYGIAVVSVLVAGVLALSPMLGEIVTVYLLGAWAAFLGALTLVISITLRGESRPSFPSFGPSFRSSRPSLSG